MLKVKYIQKCRCGAVTLHFENGTSNSMFRSTFNKIKKDLDLSDAEFLQDCWCCDHCVNHYGIDICECGSGEKVGKCSCGSHNAYQTLGEEIDHIGLIAKSFRH